MDEGKPNNKNQSGLKNWRFKFTFDGMALPPFPALEKNAQERFEAIRDMETRNNDIVLVALPKAGTHWTWEIISMLINGKAEYSKERKENVFLEMVPSLDILEDVESPRIINTHVPFRWLPKKHIERGGKIVHVIRNPKDVAVSLFHHANSSIKDSSMKLQWGDYIESFMNAPVKAYGGWFAYEKGFEEAKKKDTSIHTVHFENLKRNPEQEIRRLASYLGTEVSDELIAGITDKTSFKKLKEADQTMKEHKGFVNDLFEKKEVKDGGMGVGIQAPIIYRKGEIGDWKNYFTVAQNEQFNALYEEEMKNSNIKVEFE